MSADDLLQRLKGVKRTGQGQWKACCPSHDDRTPSLAIKETDDGTVLLKCWVGCTAYEIVSAVGLELHDLFPPRSANDHIVKGNRRAFNARDAIQSVALDGLRIAACAQMMRDGQGITDQDMAFLCDAVGRCTGIAEEVL